MEHIIRGLQRASGCQAEMPHEHERKVSPLRQARLLRGSKRDNSGPNQATTAPTETHILERQGLSKVHSEAIPGRCSETQLLNLFNPPHRVRTEIHSQGRATCQFGTADERGQAGLLGQPPQKAFSNKGNG